jgi:hypothetical protein
MAAVLELSMARGFFLERVHHAATPVSALLFPAAGSLAIWAPLVKSAQTAPQLVKGPRQV